MSASMNDLIPEFRQKAEELLEKCVQRGVEMRPYYTLRSPFEQAKLWRQSRTWEEVRDKIEEFKAAGADFLAFCFESVGPQNGGHVTNAPPGFSWHQWGEALDCFWVVEGGAEWSAIRKVNDVNGYKVYAEEAVNLGLEAGGYWRSLKDWGHVQLRPESTANKLYTLMEINDAMKERFEP